MSTDTGISYREDTTSARALCRQADEKLWWLPGNRAYLTHGNRAALALCHACPILDRCRDRIDWTDPPSGVIQAGEVWPVERGHLKPELRARVIERTPAAIQWDKIRSQVRSMHARGVQTGEIAARLDISTRNVQRILAGAVPVSDEIRALHAEYNRLRAAGQPTPDHVAAGEAEYRRIAHATRRARQVAA